MSQIDPMKLYPLTIISTRYGGAYERGDFAAFPVDYDEIPGEATGSDMTASEYWDSDAAKYIGVGESPKHAVDNLGEKLTAITDKDRLTWVRDIIMYAWKK